MLAPRRAILSWDLWCFLRCLRRRGCVAEHGKRDAGWGQHATGPQGLHGDCILPCQRATGRLKPKSWVSSVRFKRLVTSDRRGATHAADHKGLALWQLCTSLNSPRSACLRHCPATQSQSPSEIDVDCFTGCAPRSAVHSKASVDTGAPHAAGAYADLAPTQTQLRATGPTQRGWTRGGGCKPDRNCIRQAA